MSTAHFELERCETPAPFEVTAARLTSGEYRQYSLFDHAKCKKI